MRVIVAQEQLFLQGNSCSCDAHHAIRFAVPWPLAAIRTASGWACSVRGRANVGRDVYRPRELDRDHLWHPFTQQQGWVEEEPLIIERAEGSHLIDAEGRRYIDGVSSLWCNVHGHRHPGIDAAVASQLEQGRALDDARPLPRRRRRAGRRAWSSSRRRGLLARLLLGLGLDRDRDRAEDGLPVPAAARRPARPPHLFVHLRDAYHGDTIGSVSVGGIDLFHATYRPLLFAGPTPPSPATPPTSSAILARARARRSPR